MPGVEKIAWLEIRSRLEQVWFGQFLFAKDQNGIVVFDYGGPLADLLRLRTTEDVFLQGAWQEKVSRAWPDLERITDLVQSSEEFGRAANHLIRLRKFSRPPTYRVISRKYGKHQYRRKDLEEAVIKGVKKRYPAWTLVEDDAQVEVWTNLLGSQLLCGLRLSDRSMRHRYQKAVELKASLRPSVAAAMVYLTEPEPNDVFLDPMCGSGTLLLERQLAGPRRLLLGGDNLPHHVNAARQNLSAQRKAALPKATALYQGDAGQLPLAPHSVDKVASNLPFGKQTGSHQTIARLYPAFLAELQRVLRPNGRAVLLSSEYDLIKDALRQVAGLQIITGYSVAVLGQWGRIYIVERGA